MKIRDNTLVLSEYNLKNILTHVALCAESNSVAGKDVTKMNFTELFLDELDNQKWLSGFDIARYEKIEIELENI